MAAMPADAGNVMTRARAIGFICPPVGGAVNNADAQDGTDEDVRRGNWQAQQGSGHNHADSAQQVYRVVVQLGEESTAAPAAAAPERTAPLRSRSTRRHASRGKLAPVVLAANGPHRGIAPTSVWPADRSHIFQQMVIGRGHLTCRFPVRAA